MIPDDPLLGRQLGNYRLDRLIGRGGMAARYPSGAALVAALDEDRCTVHITAGAPPQWMRVFLPAVSR